MRNRLILLTLVFGVGASYPPNEQPMYGGVPKTPDMVQADEAFLNKTAQMGYSRAQAAEMSIRLGWKYLRDRDLATSMKRFNQAWLADPDNGDVYHGFAAVVLERDHDEAAADRLFRLALDKPRHTPGVEVDYGRYLSMHERYAEAVPVLRKAVAIENITPDAQALYAMALFGARDVKTACEEAAKVKQGVQPDLQKSVKLITDFCSGKR
jgi:Tfp pilus assembly protein PilF